jgi:hypothetical protein
VNATYARVVDDADAPVDLTDPDYARAFGILPRRFELHAHVDTYAADCDGPISRSYVETANDDERTSEFGDLEFRERVLGSRISWSPAEGATVTVQITADGFETNEPTEEGYRAASVRWCEDSSCDTGARSQRDVYAERAGY